MPRDHARKDHVVFEFARFEDADALDKELNRTQRGAGGAGQPVEGTVALGDSRSVDSMSRAHGYGNPLPVYHEVTEGVSGNVTEDKRAQNLMQMVGLSQAFPLNMAPGKTIRQTRQEQKQKQQASQLPGEGAPPPDQHPPQDQAANSHRFSIYVNTINANNNYVPKPTGDLDGPGYGRDHRQPREARDGGCVCCQQTNQRIRTFFRRRARQVRRILKWLHFTDPAKEKAFIVFNNQRDIAGLFGMILAILGTAFYFYNAYWVPQLWVYYFAIPAMCIITLVRLWFIVYFRLRISRLENQARLVELESEKRQIEALATPQTLIEMLQAVTRALLEKFDLQIRDKKRARARERELREGADKGVDAPRLGAKHSINRARTRQASAAIVAETLTQIRNDVFESEYFSAVWQERLVYIFISINNILVFLAYPNKQFCVLANDPIPNRDCRYSFWLWPGVYSAMLLYVFVSLPRIMPYTGPLVVSHSAMYIAGRWFETTNDQLKVYLSQSVLGICICILALTFLMKSEEMRREMFITTERCDRYRRQAEALQQRQRTHVRALVNSSMAHCIADNRGNVPFSITGTVATVRIAHFTQFCSQRSGSEIAAELNEFFAAVDEATARARMIHTHTFGDIYVTIAGLGDSCSPIVCAERGCLFAAAVLQATCTSQSAARPTYRRSSLNADEGPPLLPARGQLIRHETTNPGGGWGGEDSDGSTNDGSLKTKRINVRCAITTGDIVGSITARPVSYHLTGSAYDGNLALLQEADLAGAVMCPATTRLTGCWTIHEFVRRIEEEEDLYNGRPIAGKGQGAGDEKTAEPGTIRKKSHPTDSAVVGNVNADGAPGSGASSGSQATLDAQRYTVQPAEEVNGTAAFKGLIGDRFFVYTNLQTRLQEVRRVHFESSLLDMAKRGFALMFHDEEVEKCFVRDVSLRVTQSPAVLSGSFFMCALAVGALILLTLDLKYYQLRPFTVYAAHMLSLCAVGSVFMLFCVRRLKIDQALWLFFPLMLLFECGVCLAPPGILNNNLQVWSLVLYLVSYMLLPPGVMSTLNWFAMNSLAVAVPMTIFTWSLNTFAEMSTTLYHLFGLFFLAYMHWWQEYSTRARFIDTILNYFLAKSLQAEAVVIRKLLKVPTQALTVLDACSTLTIPTLRKAEVDPLGMYAGGGRLRLLDLEIAEMTPVVQGVDETAILILQLLDGREVAAFFGQRAPHGRAKAPLASLYLLRLCHALIEEAVTEHGDGKVFIAKSFGGTVILATVRDSLHAVGCLATVTQHILVRLSEHMHEVVSTCTLFAGPIAAALTGSRHVSFEVFGDAISTAMCVLHAAPPGSVTCSDRYSFLYECWCDEQLDVWVSDDGTDDEVPPASPLNATGHPAGSRSSAGSAEEDEELEEFYPPLIIHDPMPWKLKGRGVISIRYASVTLPVAETRRRYH